MGSRGTPRIANGLLRRVRDFAQIKGDGNVDLGITKVSLKALNVDSYGFDEMDNKILSTLIDKFKGGQLEFQQLQLLYLKVLKQLKKFMNLS